MYTTCLSTVISFCSLSHHLYADDTELFFSFLPTYLDSSIDHLQNALNRISPWTTSANRLTLNFSKTEFLLSGLSKQLAKIHNSSLNTTHSAGNLGFIFDEHLTFLTRSHLSPSPAITINYSSAFLYLSISISELAPPSPLPLFTPSLTTATLFITTCPSLRSPSYNRSRTLSHMLLLKLPNPVTSFILRSPYCL